MMSLKNLTSLLKDFSLNDHLLMNSPLEPSTILVLYGLFVFKLGPKFMKNRNPLNLKKIIVVYNIAQILLNAILFVKTIKLASHYSPFCNSASVSNTPEDVAMRKVHYYYMLLKYFDLFDTVFFVLRKKVNQVSFLHLQHHIGMAINIWVTLKYLPGGPLFFVFVWNTFVHVVMYGYYLLTTLNSSRGVWWKKYITQLQIIQHFTIFIIFATHLLNFNCSYSKKWIVYFLFHGTVTIYLFLQFYINQYVKVCIKKSK